MAVNVAQQLAAHLGARIRADRLEYVVILAPRHSRVDAVDAARRRKHELRDPRFVGELEQRLRSATLTS